MALLELSLRSDVRLLEYGSSDGRRVAGLAQETQKLDLCYRFPDPETGLLGEILEKDCFFIIFFAWD